ncbi:DNA sulfur modification protein DndD [Enterobacter sp. CFBP8995]|nr:DNA sulfur modification protein DndD [Enterobacter sp. CFBP8995]
MLIKQLTLRNFRVFNGTHIIDLAPKKRPREHHSRPIVLFGGLNGAGKTSILSAIRLALYGRLAFGAATQQHDYVEQLSSLIHSGTGPFNNPEDASVELVFTYNKNGQESEFIVNREWIRGKKDKLTLKQDGITLKEMEYDQSQGFLNELIPHGIADLFFFDGEKIAELAEDESGKILRTAVRRLLGLDLVSKLKNDLLIYIKREQAKQLGDAQQNIISELESQSKMLALKAEKLLEEADFAKIRIELLTKDIIHHEGLLNSQGGAFAQTKALEKSKVELLLKDKERLEKSIKSECDGTLPYALASNSMSDLLKKIVEETSIKQTRSFEKELRAFLIQLNQDIAFRSSSESSTRKIATEAISDSLKDYMATKPKGDLLFDISEREAGMIQQSIEQDSSKAWQRFDSSRSQLAEVEKKLEQAAANIARAPEDEQLMEIFEKLRTLDKEREKQRQKYIKFLEESREIKLSQLECVRKIQKTHDLTRHKHSSNSAFQNATNSINLLDKFSEVLIQARVKTLSSNFENAYKKLARKEDLQLSAHINPKSFDVELIDDKGNVINRKMLSAGEKQIYAIAILEALAKTSGRDLPVIIDTPLGRLDSHHRDKLINNYFPEASHQVVLLSTDTEVDKNYFVDYLRDDISHSYEIIFNARTKSSSLKPGYFWDFTKETI